MVSSRRHKQAALVATAATAAVVTPILVVAAPIIAGVVGVGGAGALVVAAIVGKAAVIFQAIGAGIGSIAGCASVTSGACIAASLLAGESVHSLRVFRVWNKWMKGYSHRVVRPDKMRSRGQSTDEVGFRRSEDGRHGEEKQSLMLYPGGYDSDEEPCLSMHAIDFDQDSRETKSFLGSGSSVWPQLIYPGEDPSQGRSGFGQERLVLLRGFRPRYALTSDGEDDYDSGCDHETKSETISLKSMKSVWTKASTAGSPIIHESTLYTVRVE
ncbi:hypothetical protein BGW38_001141, partial [Lunasporangiospora selenospora]